MMLGVDLRCLPMKGHGTGVAHAAQELVEMMARLARSHQIELLCFVGKGVRLDVPESSCVRLSGLTGRSLRRALSEQPVDALFVPSGAVAPFLSVPTYPWVHDVTIYSHPEWFPQSFLKWLVTTTLFLRGLHQSRHIFCVSEATRQDTSRQLHISLEKMTTTWQGTSVEEGGWNPRRDEPFALVVGTVEPRKNLSFLFELWPEVWQRFGLKLLVAGQRGWGGVEMPSVEWLDWHPVFSDEERNSWLQEASLVLVPSLDEGFGRTALEGMRVGVPTLVSDRGALPEVVGEGGEVLPLQPEAWVEAIGRLLDSTEAIDLGRRGQERAQAFSWEKTAETVLAKIQADWYSHATKHAAG